MPPQPSPFHLPIIRIVARQAPEEFRAALTTTASMVLGLAVIVIVHTTMENDRASRRRLMLVVVSLTAAGILAPPLLQPLAGFIDDEEGFERRYPRCCRCCPSSLNFTPGLDLKYSSCDDPPRLLNNAFMARSCAFRHCSKQW